MTVTTIISWILAIPVLFFLIRSGIDKIRGTKESIGNFEFMKLQNYRIPIGVLEIIGALFLIIPGMSMYGLLMISALMGGAVSIHLTLMGGHKTWFPMLIGVLSVASYLIK